MSVCELESIDEAVARSRKQPEVGVEIPRPDPPAGRRGFRWTLIAALAIAGLTAGLYLTGLMAAPTRIEPLPFGFRAEQRQDRVALTWDPAAKAVREATRATLSIQDGPETEDVALNLAVLPLGGLSYSPLFQSVSFRMKLAGPSHRTVSEQARVTLLP